MLEQITPLDMLVAQYRTASRKAEQAAEELRKVREELIAELRNRGVKTHEHEGLRATMVQTTTYAFDESGLRKSLGVRVYNKLTTAKLDKKKLEKAVEDGQLDPVIVAQYATEKEGAPFIRFTEKQ